MRKTIEVTRTYGICSGACSWHVCELANKTFIVSRYARRGDHIRRVALGKNQDEQEGQYRVYTDYESACRAMKAAHRVDDMADRGIVPVTQEYPEYGLEANT